MSNHRIAIHTSADVNLLLGMAGSRDMGNCDCACEASSVSIAGLGHGIEASTVLRPSPSLYRDDVTVPEHRIVFNPLAGEGVNLLGRGAAGIFDLVDGQRDVDGVVATAAVQGYSAIDTRAVLSNLYHQRLLYAGDNPPLPAHQPSTHLGVWLHITNQCNLRCTYCYISKTNEQLPITLGKRSLRAVFQAARGQGMREVTLKYAGGEALLEADTIWALDDYARELAGDEIAITSVILTNGAPLNAANLAQIKQRGMRLALSLDGLGEAHDRQRPMLGGQPSFQRVQRGLDLAQAAGVDINVSVVVGPGNMAALPELVDYLLDRDLRFSLGFLRDNDEASFELAAQDEALIGAMAATYQRIALRPPRFSIMNSALDRVQLEQPHFAACGVGESYVVIKHTGEVASCQMLLNRPLGHIREGNVIKLVQTRTRERPHGTSVDDREGCRTCDWRYRCAGGCPVVTFNTYGRFDHRSPFCHVYKTLIPQLVALEGLRIARYCAD